MQVRDQANKTFGLILKKLQAQNNYSLWKIFSKFKPKNARTKEVKLNETNQDVAIQNS